MGAETSHNCIEIRVRHEELQTALDCAEEHTIHNTDWCPPQINQALYFIFKPTSFVRKKCQYKVLRAQFAVYSHES